MNQLTFSLICLLGGLLLSALSSLVLSYYSKRKLSQVEKLRIDSLDSIDRLLSKGKRTHLAPDEIKRMWLDAMNYVMTARSPRAAEVYLGQLKTALGAEAEQFAIEAERILADRLRRSECGVTGFDER
jgi:hypothetical protein